jgi:hypothetical protein
MRTMDPGGEETVPTTREMTMEQKKHQRGKTQEPTNGGAPSLKNPFAAAGDFGDSPEMDGLAHKPASDVKELPEDLRELVGVMLTEGATFEDVYEAVNERGGPTLTLQAIQNFYRGSVDLQKRRIQFQLERARQLRESFAHPESAEAQLASAAILTGLQSLNRRGAQMTLRDFIRARLERENLMLKQDLLRLKVAREAEDQRLRRTKFQAELIKWQHAKIKLGQLRRQLTEEGKNKLLGPEAMEKIKEIYGLLRIPVVARDPDRPPKSEG